MFPAAVRSPEGPRYYQVRHRPADLPAGLAYALQRAIPSARGSSTSPSLLRITVGCWNVDQLSIGLAFRLILRSRLTLNRLSLFRKPWSSGGRVSHPPYRYLCLHLLFQTLQRTSRHAFGADWNAPLPVSRTPGLRYRAYTRSSSMQHRSTSELLRTL